MYVSLRTGVYGDVHRVKILFNKKDNALIQMADPHQAQLGKFEVCIPLHLNAKNLSIKPSASRVPSMTLLSHHLCLKNRQTKAVCHSTGYLGDWNDKILRSFVKSSMCLTYISCVFSRILLNSYEFFVCYLIATRYCKIKVSLDGKMIW